MDYSLTQTAKLVQSCDTIVLTAHVQPDGDCLGSMLALYHYLVSIGKDVKMILDDDISGLYTFLPGYEMIKAPTNDILSADILIILDASDLERIGKVREHVDAPILNIDHHVSNKKFADYCYIDTQVAATGEIVFQLLDILQAPITADIATCLYTAIATDCGFFKYANTTVQTMQYAARLMEYGAKPHLISEALETKSLASLQTLSKVLETLELHYSGKIATIAVLPDTLSSLESTEGFINYPRMIEGVEIAILFKVMTDEGMVRISFRSKRVNVSQLALSFGGGGHMRAAGCAIRGNIDDVMKEVLDATVQKLSQDLS